MMITNENISNLSRNDRIDVLSELLELVGDAQSTSAHETIRKLSEPKQQFWKRAFNEYPNVA